MKKVYEGPPNDPEAGLLMGMLEKEGIECEMRNQSGATAMGIIPPTECYAEVWVLNMEDAPKAEEIVQNWRHPQEVVSVWTCPKCGEKVEGQFTSCWKCGEPKTVTVA